MHMSQRFRFRLNLLEVGILLVLLATGWVAVNSYGTLRDFAAGRTRFHETQKQNQTLEQATSLAGAKLDDILAAKDLSDLKTEYLLMSEYLNSTMAELEKILHDLATNKNDKQLKQFQNKSQQLLQWFQNHTNRVESLKSRKLVDWLSEKQADANKASESIIDFSDLFRGIHQTLTNYLAEADFVCKNAGYPLSGVKI